MQKFEDAAIAVGYKTFREFVIDPLTPMKIVNDMRQELQKRGITF